MKSERRSHNRIITNNLKADVFPTHLPVQEKTVHAEILDISKSGIRIKLNQPLNTSIHTKLSINMILPNSGAPFTVHGVVIHRHSESEYGLQYADNIEGSIDDMIFQCVTLNDSTILIKSL